jgi:rare lipoprotein A
VEQRKATLIIASLFSTAAVMLPSMASAEPGPSGKVVQSGKASWYGPGFHGRKTASGEAFNTNALTAAHRTLPFGTKVRVLNKRNGKSVVVRINDRGPFAHGRVIDLSRASAQAIGVSGVTTVSLAQL